MKKKIKNILITNDDGFDAIGLKILNDIANDLADNVYIVSPKTNQSAKSKSITVRQEISFEKKSNNFFVVDGTPTDCIIFALNYLLKIKKPDLILSGINSGSNIGDEVSYSGTVGAAWEGAIRGFDSFALSQYGGDIFSDSYNVSKSYSLEILNYLIELKCNKTKFYNINFPYKLITSKNSKIFAFANLASQKERDEIIISKDHKSFTIGRMVNHSKYHLNTDIEIIKQNKISITPLLLNLSNCKILKKIN